MILTFDVPPLAGEQGICDIIDIISIEHSSEFLKNSKYREVQAREIRLMIQVFPYDQKLVLCRRARTSQFFKFFRLTLN